MLGALTPPSSGSEIISASSTMCSTSFSRVHSAKNLGSRLRRRTSLTFCPSVEELGDVDAVALECSRFVEDAILDPPIAAPSDDSYRAGPLG